MPRQNLYSAKTSMGAAFRDRFKINDPALADALAYYVIAKHWIHDGKHYIFNVKEAKTFLDALGVEKELKDQEFYLDSFIGESDGKFYVFHWYIDFTAGM